MYFHFALRKLLVFGEEFGKTILFSLSSTRAESIKEIAQEVAGFFHQFL